MKKIKRGKGASFLRFIGSIAAIIFGFFWTFTAYSMTKDLRATGGTLKLIGYALPFFGIIFVLMGIFEAIYNYKNAVSKKGFSEYEIIDDEDTIRTPSKREKRNTKDEYIYDEDIFDTSPNINYKKYCTECGAPLDKSYKYCPECGKKI